MIEVTEKKPLISTVSQSKPKMNAIRQPTAIYTEIRTIRKGEPMGLLLSLTYPEELTFTAVRL
jgi:hypothetical protein